MQIREGFKSGVTTLGRGVPVPQLAEPQTDGAVWKSPGWEEHTVNNIVWWVGAIVIILVVLGYLGFRT